MTLELWQLFLVALSYLAILLLVAYAAEEGWLPAALSRHPVTYALSLGVYATTWTYYGSIGLAATQGYLFLTIYLGVTLTLMLWPALLAPILRLVQEFQLQSLADLFEFRFPGRLTGFLVTLFMLLGVLPYLSLQIRAVTFSLEVLTRNTAPKASPLLAALFCVMAIVFAVMFGTRKAQPSDKHEGLVVAIAFESLVKLVALLTVGGFALFGVFGGFSGLQNWLQANPTILKEMYQSVGGSAWTTLLLLTFSATFLLPRQFHMMFTENQSPHGLRTASWLFPLFLLLLNLPIPIILWAGVSSHLGVPPDYYILELARQHGIWLTLLAFVGGVSAASAMLIVESLALAGMCLNHIVIPLWLRFSHGHVGDLYQRLRLWKRLLLVVIIATGYGSYLVIRQSQGLAEMGLISFVAVIQFLPGIAAMLLWPGATRIGFNAGLCGGMAVWFFTLILPLLGFQHSLLGTTAPTGIALWPYVVFWSLLSNASLLVLGSLLSRPQVKEITADQAIRESTVLLRERSHTATPTELQQRLAVKLGQANAQRELTRALQECGLTSDEWRPHPLLRLEARLERNLSGLVGPRQARHLLWRDVPGTHTGLLIEDQLEHGGKWLTGLAAELDHLRRLHRQVLHNLPVGACSIDHRGIVRLWNDSLAELSNLDEGSVLGLPIEQLPQPWAELLVNFISAVKTHLYKMEVALEGGTRCLNLHKESVGLEHGEPGIVVLLEDLTEQRLLEAELAHTERLASIGTFAAGVAHEIGNPLTGISSLAQNLRLENNDPEVRLAIDEILQQSRRIQEIVRSLLSFSHAGSSPTLSTSNFKLIECANQAVRLAQFAGDARKLKFIIDIPATLLICADRERLLQALLNLLVNAVDASPEGASITISGQAKAKGVTISVADQGSGIPEALRERVFEPFFTTKAPGRGTGLGLPLVFGIIRDHGGEIQLKSKPNKGTRVVLSLPQPILSEI